MVDRKSIWRRRVELGTLIVTLIAGLLIIGGAVFTWWAMANPPPPPPRPVLELAPVSLSLLKVGENTIIIPALGATVRNNGTATARGVNCQASIYGQDFFGRDAKIGSIQSDVGDLKVGGVAFPVFNLTGTRLNTSRTPPDGYNITIGCVTATGEQVDRWGVIIHDFDPQTGTGNLSVIFEPRTDKPLKVVTDLPFNQVTLEVGRRTSEAAPA